MAFQVYRVKTSDRAKLDAALGDDILSRQSLNIRDARHFGRNEDALFLFVEGTEGGILRADAMLLGFAERAQDAEDLYRRFRDEEDAAASGLGSVFGEMP